MKFIQKAFLISSILFLIFGIIYVSSSSKSIDLYDTNKEREVIKLDKPFGLYFNSQGAFNSFDIFISIGSRGNESTLSMSLYKYEESLQKTLRQEPVVFEEIKEKFGREEWYNWAFKEQEKGEYILFIENKSSYAISLEITKEAIDKVDLLEDYSVRKGNLVCRLNFVGTGSLGSLSGITEDLFMDFDRFALIDGLGREAATYKEAGPVKGEKAVGIFFHSWHDWDSARGTRNITEILKQYPEAAKDFYSPHWGTCAVYHWNEPVYNYYKNSDEWVLRRQAEVLANAGVDVIIFDNTNGTTTFLDSVENILRIFSKARADGVNTPQISFMLPTFDYESAAIQLRQLYREVYSKGRYENLWFYWKAKPLMMGYPGSLNYIIDETDKEIYNFFSYRPTNHSHTQDNVQTRDEDGNPVIYGNIAAEVRDNYIVWNWISIYPQLFAKNPDGTIEQVSVSIAQNWSEKRALTAMNGENVYGRHYSVKKGAYDTRENAKLYGANFAEQFEYAINKDPEFIFITGWNEWVVGREKEFLGVQNAFPDQYNDEYSRDIEPSLGDLKDHYYCQMVNYIRLFKGVQKPYQVSQKQTIDIYGSLDAWDFVWPEYLAYANNIFDRDSKGYMNDETREYYHYANDTGRNDFVKAKLARDDNYFYFYIECKDDITSPQDDKWMRLFIDVNDKSKKNWESFNFVVNRVMPSEKAILERSTGGWNWEKVSEIDYRLSGKTLQIKIPKKDLGIKGDKFTINFKWADNMQNDGELMEFYISGDVAPGGRFKYSYTTFKVRSYQKVNLLFYIIPSVLVLLVASISLFLYKKKKKI